MKIKNAYNTQAATDALKFREILKNFGVVGDEEEQKTFLKNWFTLAAFKYRTLSEELKQVECGDWLYEGEQVHGWYFVFRATDLFRKRHNRDPEPKDVPKLKETVAEVLMSNSVDKDVFTVDDNLVEEMCRGANSHIVTVCSVMGGIASQEVIKLLTRQFTPLQNTLIFEGNRGHGAVGEF